MKKTTNKNISKQLQSAESIPVNLGSSFNPPKQRYVRSIFNQWAGKREQAIADLTVYLENPTGIGEHPDIGEEIKKKLEEVDRYDSLMDTIKKHLMIDAESEQEAP